MTENTGKTLSRERRINNLDLRKELERLEKALEALKAKKTSKVANEESKT
jgi:hypothetical protein